MSPDSLQPVPRTPLPVVVSEFRPIEGKSHLALTIFKWHVLILSCGAVLAIAAALAMVLRPVSPSATARVLIKTGPDALAVTGLPASTGRTGADFLQTEAALLASRMVLLPVARALRAGKGETVADSDLEADVVALREALVVTIVPGTTMLQAIKAASTKDEAERHLAMILDSYVEQHATAFSGSTSLAKFFEGETGTAAAALAAAEERLQRWQQANNVISADEELRNQLVVVGDFKAALRRTEVEIDATRAHIDALTRDLTPLPLETVTSRERAVNPLIAKLKGDLATEEARLRDPSASPVLERIRTDIATAEVAAHDTGANPLVTKLKADLATAHGALNDLRQRYHDEDRRIHEKLEQIEQLQRGIGAAERDAATAATERARNLRRELVAAQREVEAATREKIKGLRAQLTAAVREGDSVARSTVALNPHRENLVRDLAVARARLTTLTSQRDGLRDQVRDAGAGLVHLQTTRLEAGRLARDVELANAVYLQNTKRLDDARVTTGLRRQQLTQVAVIEPPRATSGRIGFKRVVVVGLLGAFVGLGIGMATALALEFFNWSIRTPEDVEFYLGVPALAAVPALPIPTRPPELVRAPGERERNTNGL
jgi:uncharacterized protein involved in exopolysaccharide biosynthesis